MDKVIKNKESLRNHHYEENPKDVTIKYNMVSCDYKRFWN